MIQTTAISYINASVNPVIILTKYTSLYKKLKNEPVALKTCCCINSYNNGNSIFDSSAYLLLFQEDHLLWSLSILELLG